MLIDVKGRGITDVFVDKQIYPNLPPARQEEVRSVERGLLEEQNETVARLSQLLDECRFVEPAEFARTMQEKAAGYVEAWGEWAPLLWGAILRAALIRHGEIWVLWEHREDAVLYVRQGDFERIQPFLKQDGKIPTLVSDSLRDYECNQEGLRNALCIVDPKNRDRFTKAKEYADAVRQAIVRMTVSQDIYERVADLVRALHGDHKDFFRAVFREEVELWLARDAVKQLEVSRQRWLDVFRLYRVAQPSSRTKQYLQRLSRCVLAGFDEESVILCRCILDAEFQAEISPDDCIKILGKRNTRFTLADRIAVAVRLQRISEKTGDFALDAKRLGDQLLHQSPTQKLEVFSIVQRTLTAVIELAKRSS
jgi:hypothetical protein